VTDWRENAYNEWCDVDITPIGDGGAYMELIHSDVSLATKLDWDEIDELIHELTAAKESLSDD
jgi:hypothetical protein